MKRIAFMLAVVMLLCGCGAQNASRPQGVGDASLVPPVSAGLLTPTSVHGGADEAEDGAWRVNRLYTTWLEKSSPGYGQAPADVPAGVVAMVPIIEAVLEARFNYDLWLALGYFEGELLHTATVTNETRQHSCDNQEYMWIVLSSVLTRFGQNLDGAITDNKEICHISESSARELLKICFCEFDAACALPKQAPDGIAGYTGISYSGGEYLYSRADSLYAREYDAKSYYVVTFWCENYHGAGYRLILMRVSGPDEDQFSTFEVQLKENNLCALGFEYTIESIARLDDAVKVWSEGE